jgi:O-antigen/teichoic acid export membrane protein
MALKKLIYTAFFWRCLNYVSVFLLSILTARILGASVSGEVYYVITFFSLIILFASLNLESSLTYFSLSREIPISHLVSISLSWLFLFLIIFLACFDLFYGSQSIGNQEDIKAYSFLFIAGMLLTAYYTSLFYGQRNFKVPNIVCFVANTIFIFVIVYAIVYGRSLTATEYLHFYFIISIIQGVVIAVAFHMIYNPKFSFQLPTKVALKKMFRFSAFTFVTSVFLFLLYRIDYWLIARLNSSLDASLELGNYIQVSKLIFSFQVFSSMIGAGIFSGTVSNHNIKSDQIPGRIIRLFFYFGIISFFTLLFFGRILFVWIYGESFGLMFDFFLLLLPGAVMLMTASVTANYLSGLGKLSYNLIGVASSLFLMIVLDIIFIPLYGIYAAAAISGVSYFVYGLFMLTRFAKHYNGGWKSILSFRNDPAIVRSAIFKR